MVLDHLRQYLGPARECFRIHVGIFQIRNNRLFQSFVLFFGFKVHTGLLFTARFFESRIKNFFFNLGVNTQLIGNFLQEFQAGFFCPGSRVSQLCKQTVYLFMILFEHIYRVCSHTLFP